jgi:hypothetical protein
MVVEPVGPTISLLYPTGLDGQIRGKISNTSEVNNVKEE